MVIYSTAELAVLCGKSERSIQLWLQQGKLPARRIKANLYEISETDLEPFIPRTLERSFQDQIDALSARISDLEAILKGSASTTRTPPVESHSTRSPAAQPRVQSSEVPIPIDIPQSSMLFSAFASRHGVSASTMKDQLLRGDIPCVARPKPGRPRETGRWLRPSDQTAAIRFWKSNGTVFQECPACPHE